MNNPVDTLVMEHDIIMSYIDAAKAIHPLAESQVEEYVKRASELVDFFREYADCYHHKKEEAILFPGMSKENELLSEGIIKEMLENHEEFRNDISEIKSALERKDLRTADSILQNYCNKLLDHIAVENDELFQMVSSLIPETEQEKMYFEFVDIDRELGLVQKQKWESLIH